MLPTLYASHIHTFYQAMNWREWASLCCQLVTYKIQILHANHKSRWVTYATNSLRKLYSNFLCKSPIVGWSAYAANQLHKVDLDFL